LELAQVFDEYPNPLFIVRPIIKDGYSDNFEYIYVNKAFALFLGKNQNELIGHTYLDCFSIQGEKIWLDLFKSAALDRKHTYVNNISSIINKKLFSEVFHIDPNLCGCIIHDFQTVTEGMVSVDEGIELLRKANYDFLTGFYNRYYLKEMYAEINHKSNVGVTFLDINNLKETNDNFGHTAGDRLIIKVSNLIRTYYTDSLIFRIGGDEFVILTIGKTREEFASMSDKCIEVFEKTNLAAIGYNFYDKVDNLDECIKWCDSAMYSRKKQMKRPH
jgi:diguanylate cyclase (GGDEF)-like protein